MPKGQSVVKRPTHIKVGHLVYAVVVGGQEWLEAKVSVGDGDCLMGHTDNHRCIISMKPDMPPMQEIDTLMHEVTHAIACAHGAVLHAVTEMTGEAAEEFVASMMGGMLTQVLRDNPKLVAYVTQPVVF